MICTSGLNVSFFFMKKAAIRWLSSWFVSLALFIFKNAESNADTNVSSSLRFNLMYKRTAGIFWSVFSVPSPFVSTAGIVLFKNISGTIKLLPSMKKIKMHITTSTIGVMFGPTCDIFFNLPALIDCSSLAYLLLLRNADRGLWVVALLRRKVHVLDVRLGTTHQHRRDPVVLLVLVRPENDLQIRVVALFLTQPRGQFLPAVFRRDQFLAVQLHVRRRTHRRRNIHAVFVLQDRHHVDRQPAH